MPWKPKTFDVLTNQGKVAVRGIARRGLGLHLVGTHPDGQRGVWHLVHLRSGLAFLIINMRDEELAAQTADLIIKFANWRNL
jgi:hypothetical protein